MALGGYIAGQPTATVLSSGSLASGSLANATVVSGTIASGQIWMYHLALAAINSGYIASGAVLGQAGGGTFHIASGTLATYDAASGMTVQRAQLLAPLYSGLPWNALTAETISGARAVAYNQSGQIQIAMAAVSGRGPAIGVVADNVLSGIQANVYIGGFLQFGSGLADYSGYVSKHAWLGRSGQITSISGSFSSGGFASGDVGQVLGAIANSGAILLNVSQIVWSGGPLGMATGGGIL